MKYLSIILLLTINVFAINCKAFDDNMKYKYEQIFDYNLSVKSGIWCDNYGLFVNATVFLIPICKAEYWLNNKETKVITIIEPLKLKTTEYFDEFMMPIREEKETNTNMTCVNLYNKFKK